MKPRPYASTLLLLLATAAIDAARDVYATSTKQHVEDTQCDGIRRLAMGECSSGFVQCIDGRLVARRCPGQTLFDERIGLCVYELDGCEMLSTEFGNELDSGDIGPAVSTASPIIPSLATSTFAPIVPVEEGPAPLPSSAPIVLMEEVPSPSFLETNSVQRPVPIVNNVLPASYYHSAVRDAPVVDGWKGPPSPPVPFTNPFAHSGGRHATVIDQFKLSAPHYDSAVRDVPIVDGWKGPLSPPVPFSNPFAHSGGRHATVIDQFKGSGAVKSYPFSNPFAADGRRHKRRKCHDYDDDEEWRDDRDNYSRDDHAEEEDGRKVDEDSMASWNMHPSMKSEVDDGEDDDRRQGTGTQYKRDGADDASEDDEGIEDGSGEEEGASGLGEQDDEDESGGRRSKRSAGFGSHPLRSARFSRLCLSRSSGDVIAIGQCRQDFAYCRSARRPVVAACPMGDLFDSLLTSCVSQDACGSHESSLEQYHLVIVPSEDLRPIHQLAPESATMPVEEYLADPHPISIEPLEPEAATIVWEERPLPQAATLPPVVQADPRPMYLEPLVPEAVTMPAEEFDSDPQLVSVEHQSAIVPQQQELAPTEVLVEDQYNRRPYRPEMLPIYEPVVLPTSPPSVPLVMTTLPTAAPIVWEERPLPQAATLSPVVQADPHPIYVEPLVPEAATMPEEEFDSDPQLVSVEHQSVTQLVSVEHQSAIAPPQQEQELVPIEVFVEDQSDRRPYRPQMLPAYEPVVFPSSPPSVPLVLSTHPTAAPISREERPLPHAATLPPVVQPAAAPCAQVAPTRPAPTVRTPWARASHSALPSEEYGHSRDMGLPSRPSLPIPRRPTPPPLSSHSNGGRFDARHFCASRAADGLYRHPEKCSAFVQCFDGEAIAYPPCEGGLVFNERIQRCDYAANVPECATDAERDTGNAEGSCSGQPHGAHLADDKDCSAYYRCVWGRLVALRCPAGTVFNPRLSVCDYPSQVPHCSASKSPNTH